MPRRKPNILKHHAEHIRLSKKIAEAEQQARKFAEQCVHFTETGNVKRAARAKAQALQWLIIEKETKEKLAELERRR